jgi:Flp pilus assembly protein TadG
VKPIWGRKAADERGAVLVIPVVGVVPAVVAAALAVDLGSLAHEKRSDQKVADLAALDAVRGLNDSYILGAAHPVLTVLTPKLLRATTLAQESALKNGYDRPMPPGATTCKSSPPPFRTTSPAAAGR